MEENAVTLISIRAYARSRSCSDTAVHKAINSGKIVKGLVNGKINPVIADEEWKANFDATRSTNKKLTEKITHTQEPITPKAQTEEAAPGGGQMGQLARARLAGITLKAQLLDLDLKERKGSLVDKDKVYSALFSAGQEIKSALQVIPDRHIDNILSAGSRNEAHAILYNAISDALEILSDVGKRDLVPRAA